MAKYRRMRGRRQRLGHGRFAALGELHCTMRNMRNKLRVLLPHLPLRPARGTDVLPLRRTSVCKCVHKQTHTHTHTLSLSLSLANTRGDSHLYLSFFPEACLCAQACLCQIMCQIMSDHTHTHASVESHTHAFHTAHAGVDVSERAYRFKCRVWFVCGPFLSCFRFLHHRCLLDDTQSGLYICGVCLCTIYVTIILIYYI